MLFGIHDYIRLDSKSFMQIVKIFIILQLAPASLESGRGHDVGLRV